MNDYKDRVYLSTNEVAKYLGIRVRDVLSLIQLGKLLAQQTGGGQYRISINDVKKIELEYKTASESSFVPIDSESLEIYSNETSQKVYFKNSQNMSELKANSVHLIITSPPYFNANMYSNDLVEKDLGNIHDMDQWFSEIGKVWKEVYRVLQPGRKFFLNIMNLPIRYNNTFKTLNLVGKSTDLCEDIGFIFKRDIIWHKTNGVRAHFGTYPYPGGILINNMHEFILEFQKPDDKKFDKYAHLTNEIKEKSKIDKEFWLSLKNSDVWQMHPEKSGDGREHIAPFPHELPYRLIKAYTYIGETILDPFCGSGTTLFAAKHLRRNGVGYEINANFRKIIESKFRQEIRGMKNE
jgi:excisionase family DNA binding protein